MQSKYQPLFQPLLFSNGLIARNKVVLAPMTHYSSYQDGSMNPAELPYLKRRSASVGMVITACYAVTANGKAFTGQPSIDDDKYLPDLQKIASTIKQQGALAILQLHHGGGVCPPELVPNGDVVAPSAIDIPERSLVTPRELEADEIEEIITAFAEGARRAIVAGFDGVELHGAYGYLLQQFISPYSNQRKDKWGEPFALPLTVIRRVQEMVHLHAKGPFLIGYRFTPEEDLQPGLTMADALKFTEALVNSKVDFIDVLLNDYRSTPRAGLPDLSERRLTLLKQQIAGRTVLISGGAISTADDGAEALQTGIDAITIGRGMIIDPEWVEKVAAGRAHEIVTALSTETPDELDLPAPLWQTIWSAPGWFPGTLK